MARKSNREISINFNASMDIGEIKSAVSSIQKSFDSINLPENVSKKLLKDLEKLQSEMGNFEALSSGMKTIGDIDKADRTLQKVYDLYRQINFELKSISKKEDIELLPNSTKKDINSAKKYFDGYQKSMEEVRKKAEQTRAELKKLQDLEVELPKLKNAAAGKKRALTKAQNEKIKEDSEYVQLATQKRNLTNQSRKKNISADDQKDLQLQLTIVNEKLEKIKARYNEVERAAEDAAGAFSTAKNEYDDILNKLKKVTGKETFEEIAEAVSKIDNANTDTFLNELIKNLKTIEGLNLEGFTGEFEDFERILNDLSDEELNKVKRALDNSEKSAESMGNSMDSLREGIEGVGDRSRELNKVADEIEGLKRQVIDFFSVGNAVNIFQRAVENAFNSVKELDAAMTETSVVTDFSIGDMWDKLPEYSSIARELGSTTLDVYNATTLLYQQGLKENEVMESGVEILKFARIAGLEAGDATNYMTAAIRGFNLEMNETNTQRVNDVYSELAA